MDAEERRRLRKEYSLLPDEEIIEMLSVSEKEYERGVYQLIKQEARKRGIEERVDKDKSSENSGKGEVQQEVNIPEGYRELFVGGTMRTIKFEGVLVNNGIEYYKDSRNSAYRSYEAVFVKESDYPKALELLNNLDRK